MHQMSLYLHDNRIILAGGGTLFCYNEDQNQYRAKDRVYLRLTANIMSAYNGCPQVTYDNCELKLSVQRMEICLAHGFSWDY